MNCRVQNCWHDNRSNWLLQCAQGQRATAEMRSASGKSRGVERRHCPKNWIAPSIVARDVCLMENAKCSAAVAFEERSALAARRYLNPGKDHRKSFVSTISLGLHLLGTTEGSMNAMSHATVDAIVTTLFPFSHYPLLQEKEKEAIRIEPRPAILCRHRLLTPGRKDVDRGQGGAAAASNRNNIVP